jgi:hypothetical protein
MDTSFSILRTPNKCSQLERVIWGGRYGLTHLNLIQKQPAALSNRLHWETWVHTVSSAHLAAGDGGLRAEEMSKGLQDRPQHLHLPLTRGPWTHLVLHIAGLTEGSHFVLLGCL